MQTPACAGRARVAQTMRLERRRKQSTSLRLCAPSFPTPTASSVLTQQQPTPTARRQEIKLQMPQHKPRQATLLEGRRLLCRLFWPADPCLRRCTAWQLLLLKSLPPIQQGRSCFHILFLLEPLSYLLCDCKERTMFIKKQKNASYSAVAIKLADLSGCRLT